MKNHYDVIVVGGGILGCAAAFSLARRKAGRILLIERTTLGAQTTSRAAALITRARDHAQDRSLIAHTHRNIEILNRDYGEDIPFNRVGSLHVGETPASARAIETSMHDLAGEDIAIEWINAAQACNQTGWLNLTQAEAIAYVPDDGYVDPYILCAAYARAAKAEGIEIVQGEEVTALSPHQVTTSSTTYTCDQVVVTAGPWMNTLISHIPMAPVRSQYWITAAHPDIHKEGPVVILPDARAYARPEVGGLLFGLRDDESVYASPKDLPRDLAGFSFNEDHDGWEALTRACDAFMQRCLLLNHVMVNHYISGPSSYTPDGHYIIGRINDYIVAGGACGAGIAISGGVGEAVADLIKDPRTTFPRYAPQRFGAIDGFDDAFLKRCAQARSQKRAG